MVLHVGHGSAWALAIEASAKINIARITILFNLAPPQSKTRQNLGFLILCKLYPTLSDVNESRIVYDWAKRRGKMSC
jgi:hypothetical protein